MDHHPNGLFQHRAEAERCAAGTLTVRARVRSDLEVLQAAVLPGLGPITESKTTHYRFRTIAPQALVEAAMAKLTAQLDYSNFKNQVAKVQGSKRAHIWEVLNRMQGDPAYEMKHKPVVHGELLR